MPASKDRAEHVSLLRWQLEPESARTARVTKQSPVPVTAFLTCAALFFTACVGVLWWARAPRSRVRCCP